MTSEKAPERHKDTNRNRLINKAVDDLEQIINHHDPEVDCPITQGVWDRLDRLCADVADAMVAEEIANRDAMEEAFSKAYALVIGAPMEWSSAYNQAEALGDMEERLARLYELRADAAQAMVAAAYEVCAAEADKTGTCLLPSGHFLSERCGAAIRALTPADASAALAERDNATWNAAIDAAAQVARDREAACTDWFKGTRQHANVYEQLPIVASDIAALKKEKPE